MEAIVLEFLGGLLGGVLAGLTVVRRTRPPLPKTTLMLIIEKPRSASMVLRRKAPPTGENERSTAPLTGNNRRRARTKTPGVAAELGQAPDTAITTTSFETCPSCGLQAPMSLLAEHFLGSPSHRNGPPATVKADPTEVRASKQAVVDDTKESVRNLLQMLVPPRAFGHRHAHRSVNPISPIVINLPSHRRYP